MAGNGWRTIIIDKASKLSVSNNHLVCSYDNRESQVTVPLDQIQDVVIASNQCSISIPLINELTNNKINTIICDSKNNASSYLVPILNTGNASKGILNQIEWDINRKDIVWTGIVTNKMKNQISTLDYCFGTHSSMADEYVKGVVCGDKTNKEAQMARLYFQTMFGKGFVRHESEKYNAELNYGYAILRSCFSRIIAIHGYHDSIGIHHNSKANPFNFACDLMEPFRSIVDMKVHSNKNNKFDREYKHELVSVLQANVIYNGNITKLSTAADLFFLDVIKLMNKEDCNIPIVEVVYE